MGERLPLRRQSHVQACTKTDGKLNASFKQKEGPKHSSTGILEQAWPHRARREPQRRTLLAPERAAEVKG